MKNGTIIRCFVVCDRGGWVEDPRQDPVQAVALRQRRAPLRGPWGTPCATRSGASPFAGWSTSPARAGRGRPSAPPWWSSRSSSFKNGLHVARPASNRNADAEDRARAGATYMPRDRGGPGVSAIDSRRGRRGDPGRGPAGGDAPTEPHCPRTHRGEGFLPSGATPKLTPRGCSPPTRRR